MQGQNNKMIQELAMISHEFRRPLDTISKSAELVNRANEMGMLDNKKLSEIMNGIITSCHRLSHLTTQILSLAKIESNTVKILVERYNLAEFMADLHRFVTLYESTKNVKFSFNIKLKDSFMVCDFKRLELILLNLISNAVKYSGKNNRRITIKVYEEDDLVCFSVKDRGIGISEHQQKKIFEKFYRIETFETRHTEGCGLGLAIVKEYTHALGGKIELISAEGKGSEFIVKLPRTQENHILSKLYETAHSYQLYKSSVDEAFADI